MTVIRGSLHTRYVFALSTLLSRVRISAAAPTSL